MSLDSAESVTAPRRDSGSPRGRKWLGLGSPVLHSLHLRPGFSPAPSGHQPSWPCGPGLAPLGFCALSQGLGYMGCLAVRSGGNAMARQQIVFSRDDHQPPSMVQALWKVILSPSQVTVECISSDLPPGPPPAASHSRVQERLLSQGQCGVGMAGEQEGGHGAQQGNVV